MKDCRVIDGERTDIRASHAKGKPNQGILGHGYGFCLIGGNW